MDFAETEDQKMIRGMVREFAEDVAGPTCNKRDKEQIAPIEEFKKFAELGFAGMTIPEKYGGQKLIDEFRRTGGKNQRSHPRSNPRPTGRARFKPSSPGAWGAVAPQLSAPRLAAPWMMAVNFYG